MSKTITVIVRAYNSSLHIHVALDSVLNQTLRKDLYEVLVVDDGSTDTTKDVVSSYGSTVKLVESRHSGAVKAANIGIQHASGTYVILLDSDDFFEMTALAELKSAIETRDGDVAYCDYYERKLASDEVAIVSLRKQHV